MTKIYRGVNMARTGGQHHQNIQAWEKRKKMHITTSLQNYLYKSVRNEFLNQYKKNRSTMILEQKYFEALDKATYNRDENELQTTLARITKEIQNLPPKCREVFIMSRKEGLTNLEISEYLNISVKTVEAQITKAFTILRKELDKRCKTILFMLMGKVSYSDVGLIDIGPKNEGPEK